MFFITSSTSYYPFPAAYISHMTQDLWPFHKFVSWSHEVVGNTLFTWRECELLLLESSLEMQNHVNTNNNLYKPSKTQS